ncbi:MAG: hypothetical protein ACR2QT_09785 [Woeseiaceae bacterium]
MNHRIGRLVFGFSVGLLVAFLSYRWVADTGPRLERQEQERIVAVSREHLHATLNIGELELVDPLSPDRVVGKAYVYPAGEGWEVSGFYRRDDQDLWHPYLVTLNATTDLVHLKISDTSLLSRSGDGVLEVLP